MSIRVNRSTSHTPDNGELQERKEGVVSESFIMGEASTLPLIFLEGEMQRKEFHKPGLSMGPINILEEDNPQVIKEYLCSFIDIPTNMLNAGLISQGEESICIDLGGPNNSSENGNWCVREVTVTLPKMVFGSGSIRKVESKATVRAIEKTSGSKVVERSYSSMDDILDEFSVELERKMMENGFGSEEKVKEETPKKNGVWWMKEKPKEEKQIAGIEAESVQKGITEQSEIEASQTPDSNGKAENVDFDETLDGIIDIMMELESEKKGTEEERAKLRDMIKEIEEKRSSLSEDRTGEGELELLGIVSEVEEKINELKMDKIDSELEKAAVDGALAHMEDKMTDLELSQIESDAEKVELKRIMDEMEDKIAGIEDGSIEAEVAKAELEGMMAGIEDMMTELEISQLGSEAEKSEMRRTIQELEKKIFDLAEQKDREMEDKLKGMEEKMAQMEIQIQGNEDRMQKLKTEMEVRKFTMEYIKDLEDRGELETLCSEVGLSCDGSKEDLRERLFSYVKGIPKEEGKVDPRFTKENIESVKTKAELVTLCEEAGLKKSGKKEELRQRLLEYIEEREQKAQEEKLREKRFSPENIQSITTKVELIALCDEADLDMSGTKEELRDRLLEYAKEHEVVESEPSIPSPSVGLGAPDKLVYAIMGDMYKHLSHEMGDGADYGNDLEIFIRSILQVRQDRGVESNEILKSIVVKPNKVKTAEVLKKLTTPFLEKVKAENLEVVQPEEEWEGIKLNMIMDKELIAATYKAQSTKIRMLLRMQPPQKIKKIMEEKGEYTLGVEGYPVTISSSMLTFKEIIPENFEIRETESGMLYIEKNVIKSLVEEELPPPPPGYVKEEVPIEKEPQELPEEPQPEQMVEEAPQTEDIIEPPTPPQRKKRKKRTTKKKKSLIGKLRSRFKR